MVLWTPGRRPDPLQREVALALEFVAQEEGLGRSQSAPILATALMLVTKLVFPPGRLRRPVWVLDLLPVAVPEAAASYLRVFVALYLQV